MKNKETIVILDFYSQFNQLIARRVRECNVYSEVLPYDTPIEKGILINNQNPNYKVQRDGSGTLVTHKFLQAMDIEFNLNWSSFCIDLVALSLISDSMNMNNMEKK